MERKRKNRLVCKRQKTHHALDSSKGKKKFFKVMPLTCPPPLRNRRKEDIAIVPISLVNEMKSRMKFEYGGAQDTDVFEKTDVYDYEQSVLEASNVPTFSKFPSIQKMQMDEWMKTKEKELAGNGKIMRVCEACNARQLKDSACEAIFSNCTNVTVMTQLKLPKPRTIEMKEKIMQMNGESNQELEERFCTQMKFNFSPTKLALEEQVYRHAEKGMSF